MSGKALTDIAKMAVSEDWTIRVGVSWYGRLRPAM